MKDDLTADFEESVKKTAKIVVSKLVDGDAQLQASYLDTLVKEVTTH